MASAAIASRMRIGSRNFTSGSQVQHRGDADLLEVMLERGEVGVVVRKRVVVLVRTVRLSHRRIDLGEQVVGVLDDVVSAELVPEAERADAPALPLLESV